jgi:lysophospholipase L1-like esterase
VRVDPVWLPLLVLLIAGGCLPRSKALPPGEAQVRLLGRWDATGAPDRLTAVNPGSSFRFRYQGTWCQLQFDRSANKRPFPQLWVRFDGAWTRHVLDRDAIDLGRDAPQGEHDVWGGLKSADEHQRRWTPPLVASVTLMGIALPQGAFLRAPRRPARIIEFVGDSMTEGILVHSREKGKGWPDFADSRMTYAFRTAQALDAEPRLIAFGAQGVTQAGNGGVPPVPLAYPFVYDRVPADDPPADIVVIAHGCNDSAVASITAGYRNLIGLIRERNPDAAIVCMVPFPQCHPDSIARAAAAEQAAGDRQVFFLPTRGWLDKKADTTDGVHPNVQGHAKAAQRLVEFIREHVLSIQ